MKNLFKTFAAITFIVSFTMVNFSCSKKSTLKALILTGQNNHNWERSSPVLKTILEKSGLFTAEIKISPKKGEDMSGFIVDFEPYDLVILDYLGDAWPDKTRKNFVDYVYNGGGVVVYHAANNAFGNWSEYNEIIGIGWRANEKAGPYVYVKDGKVVRDNSPGKGGSHGSQHEFLVQAYNPDHPILKGLPEKWMQARDELYDRLRGPANNLEVLAYAYSDTSFRGSGRNEPVLMTITYGEGRIFHTMLGHTWKDRMFFPPMESAGFIVTFQRGAEWAATGKVTQKVPTAFPTETRSLQWEFFEDIHTDISPVVKRMKEYEIGKSSDCFIILKNLMAENLENSDKMNEYHQIIRQLLNSRKTTDECKKVLCREFSWAADGSYRDIYKNLLQNPRLAGEAQFALEMMGN